MTREKYLEKFRALGQRGKPKERKSFEAFVESLEVSNQSHCILSTHC